MDGSCRPARGWKDSGWLGSFNQHKQWRALATRYDKLAAVYRGGVVLRAITIWLRE